MHCSADKSCLIKKHRTISKPRGLFDEQFRLQKLSKKRDPLEQLSSHIDFEFFRKPMRKFFDKNKLRQKDTDIRDSEVMDLL
jgi:hypothetical protein